MFLKKLFLLSLIITSFKLHAETIHVEYGFNIFSFEFNDTEIKYQKKNYIDTVKKRDCSQNLFRSFTQKLSALSKQTVKDDNDNGDFMVKYRFNKKTGKLLPTNSFAKRLLVLPQEFDTFRLATEFRCESEKSE